MSSFDVIFLEDNEDFCFFIQKALDKNIHNVDYKITKSGEEFLNQIGIDSQQKIKPKLFFLDINLPDINGLDLLKRLKESNDFRSIPVVMLSTSNNPNDIEQAVKYGVNAYVAKPSSFKSLSEFIDQALDFWLNHNLTAVSNS